MAINSFQVNDTVPIVSLGTNTLNVTPAGPYTIQVQCTIPLNSGLQIVINQNGSAVVTVGGSTTNPTPTQQILSAGANLYCNNNDVITVVLSSSAAADQIPNNVKGQINFFQII